MPGVRVDRVLTEGTRVVGVQAGDDELRAHVVVATDGVNSFIAKEAGLRQKEPLNHLAVGVSCTARSTLTPSPASICSRWPAGAWPGPR
jgi:electron transfer flavoprotein-quinone oxidoreductase